MTPRSHDRGEVRIALAQIATCPAQLGHNLERHLEMLDRARAVGAQLVVFPELYLSGYVVAHGVLEMAMRADDPRLAPLFAASREIALLVGLPLREPDGRISNAALLLEGNELRGVHRKLYLSAHGRFDERRWFMPGPRLQPLECSLGRFGVLIGEDAWHLSSALHLAQAGAEALLIMAGTPTELDAGNTPAGGRRWQHLVATTAITTVQPVLLADRCGWEEGILFGGCSGGVDALGRPLTTITSFFEEALVTVSYSRADTVFARSLQPAPCLERLELGRSTLERGHA